MSDVAWLVWAAMAGLIVGSFLNVVVHRLPLMLEQQWAAMSRACLGMADPPSGAAPFNLARPGSHCPHCRAPVRWRHNVPVLSWLWLRGRCADCGGVISARYPLVELAAALLFLACAWRFGVTGQAVAAMGLCAGLLTLACIDIDTRLLPDAITLPLLWAGLLVNAWDGWFASPSQAIVGAALGYGLLWGVASLFARLTGKEGMGQGDFKLLAALGAWFGWQAVPQLVLVSALLGIVIGLFWRWRHADVYAPFGPALAAAGVACLFYGP